MALFSFHLKYQIYKDCTYQFFLILAILRKKGSLREISPFGDESMLDHDPAGTDPASSVKGRNINTLLLLKNVEKAETQKTATVTFTPFILGD